MNSENIKDDLFKSINNYITYPETFLKHKQLLETDLNRRIDLYFKEKFLETLDHLDKIPDINKFYNWELIKKEILNQL